MQKRIFFINNYKKMLKEYYDKSEIMNARKSKEGDVLNGEQRMVAIAVFSHKIESKWKLFQLPFA
jgi:cell fate regulator YaaT (PSP1 superfamily)